MDVIASWSGWKQRHSHSRGSHWSCPLEHPCSRELQALMRLESAGIAEVDVDLRWSEGGWVWCPASKYATEAAIVRFGRILDAARSIEKFLCEARLAPHTRARLEGEALQLRNRALGMNLGVLVR